MFGRRILGGHPDAFKITVGYELAGPEAAQSPKSLTVTPTSRVRFSAIFQSTMSTFQLLQRQQIASLWSPDWEAYKRASGLTCLNDDFGLRVSLKPCRSSIKGT
jgi:hypothetical protein